MAQNLPAIPAEALLQPETRPRCDTYDDGLILNLRGINLNGGEPADQMVSIRMSVTQDAIVTVQDEHDLQVAQRQASHGYRLSLAAGIFLPLGFLTGLFGVNIAGMPGLENPWAFIMLCSGMVALAVLLTLLLRYGRWL